jgi:hypothetical protein
MFKQMQILCLLLLIAPVVAWSDLTGVWRSDDNGTYYLRQSENMLSWYGEHSKDDPAWSNVYRAEIHGDVIQGRWSDAPKGRGMSSGTLSLKIEHNGNVLLVVQETGGFGSSRWIRVGYNTEPAPAPVPAGVEPPVLVSTPQPDVKQTPAPVPKPAAKPVPAPALKSDIKPKPTIASAPKFAIKPAIAPAKAPKPDLKPDPATVPAPKPAIKPVTAPASTPKRSIKPKYIAKQAPAAVLNPITLKKSLPKPAIVISLNEDCAGFSALNAKIVQIDGHWKIVDGNYWIFDFGSRENEARRALMVIRHYRLNRYCFVGRPEPSFAYMKRDNQVPTGPLLGEDCVEFSTYNAKLVRINERWRIIDRGRWLYDFSDKKAEARKSLAVIKNYGVNNSCFVGRPNPSFSYLRK